MTRRKFIRRLILAGAAAVSGGQCFRNSSATRRYIRAARAKRYPGALRRVGRINTIGKWSG